VAATERTTRRQRMTKRPGVLRRRHGLVFTIAAGGLLVIASLAVGAGLSTKSKSVTVGSEDAATVTAKCKQGQKAVSGGFQAPLPSSAEEDPVIVPYASHKQGGGKWALGARNFGGAAGQAKAFAYCRDGKRLVKKSSSITIPPEGAIGSVTVSCDRGSKAISGGFEHADFELGTIELLAYESRRRGARKWIVSGVNVESDPAILTGYVYCRDGDGLKKASKSAPAGPSIFEMDSDVVGSGKTTARCEKGERVVSGGFDNPDFDQDRQSGPQLFPTVSKKKGGRKWTVTSLNNGLVGGTMKAFAYCEKK
jgi:hypothetical protein